MKSKPRDGYTTYELKVNDIILAAAIAVTNAIAQLIKAKIDAGQRVGHGGGLRRCERWSQGG